MVWIQRKNAFTNTSHPSHVKKVKQLFPKCLDYTSDSLAGICLFPIPLCMCVNCRLRSRTQSPELKRIINTHTCIPEPGQESTGRNHFLPHTQKTKRFGPNQSRCDNDMKTKMCDMGKISSFQMAQNGGSCFPKCPLLLGRKELKVS